MTSHEQVAPINERSCKNSWLSCLKMSDCLKFLSSLLLPLALGVFTSVITMQQQKASELQRALDRITSAQQLEQERNLTAEKYKNELFDSYMRGIAELLEKYNGSLTNDKTSANIARAKTLNIFRNLDAQRNAQIVRFLHEAGQLNSIHEYLALDLSSAKLKNIDFRNSAINEKQLKYLSLRNTFLSDAIFEKLHMEYVDFTDTEFRMATFSSARLTNVRFTAATLDDVIFLATRLEKVDFTQATMNNSDFSLAQLNSIKYLYGELNNSSVDFTHIIASQTDFQEVTSIRTKFNYANLSQSTFRGSNLKHSSFAGTDLTNANFTGANLYKVNLTDSKIDDVQLRNALSIQDVVLPNGTVANDTNLIKNGEANCHVSPAEDWTVPKGTVITVTSNENQNDCLFSSFSNAIEATMLQYVSLSDIWDTVSWPYSKAVLTAQMSKNVFLVLSAVNSTGQIIVEVTLNKSHDNVSIILKNTTRELMILVNFNPLLDQAAGQKSWCDNVKLFIEYGTNKELIRDKAFPLRCPTTVKLNVNARWQQNAITVAGGNGKGDGVNQFAWAFGLYVDDDQTVYVADQFNHRVIEWKVNAMNGSIIVGGNGQGSGSHQLSFPFDMIADKKTDSIIVCDNGNARIVRWPRRNGRNGETIIHDCSCWGLTMDENGSLYTTDVIKHEVRRYGRGESQGRVVAGGNGAGNRLDQLDWPVNVFVDQDHSVYVSDLGNDRVMKWTTGAKQGSIVAGGRGQGNDLTQLSSPHGIVVDQLGTVYVVDTGNDRVVCWPKRATKGSLIAGGRGGGIQPDQFYSPVGLSFDGDGNLYVADHGNNRVQRFDLLR